MKKLILTLSLLGCVSWAQAEPIEIKGTVDGIFAGEMDSFKLGDILIFFVRNGADNKRYGLVDFDDEFYYYNGDFEKEFLNKWVMIDRTHLASITDEETLRILNKYDENAVYLQLHSYEFVQRLPVAYQKTEKIRSDAIHLVQILGHDLAKNNIGGSAGFTEIYHVQSKDAALSNTDVLRELVYNHIEPRELEFINIFGISSERDAIRTAVDKLLYLKNERSEAFKGHFSDLLEALVTSRPELEFFSGTFADPSGYETSLLSMLDPKSGEYILIFQGD